MSSPLSVLLVEDCADDAELVLRALRRADYEPTWERVETAGDLARALATGAWDVVLCDSVMPRFSGPEALRQVQAFDPDLPVILVSGEVSQAAAVESMRAGARDYVMKDDLARLAPVVARELAEAQRHRREQGDRTRRREGERQVAAMLMQLASVSAEQMDACVTASLRSIARLAGEHCAAVFLAIGDGAARAQVRCAWSATGAEQPLIACLTDAAASPWWWERLRAGVAIVVSRPDDLPAEAAAERVALVSSGMHAVAAVPLHEGRDGCGFLGLCADRELPIAADDLIAILRVVGEVTLGALGRARAELALRESECRYRDLVENLSEVIYTLDADGVITYVSPNAEAYSGYSRELILGRPATALVHEDDRADVLAGFQRALAGDPLPTEFRVVLRSGEVRWVRSSSRPVLRHDVAVGVRGVLVDITADKREQEQRELFELVAAQAPVGIALTDAAGQVTGLNPLARAILGSPSEDASRQLNVLRVPALREAGVDDLFRAAIERGEPGALEARYRSHWGKEAFVSLHVAPLFDARRRVRGSVAVIEDATARLAIERELRDREERLRIFIDNMAPSVLVGLTTPDGSIIEVNRSALELVGLGIDDVRGVHVADVPPFAHSAEVQARVRESVRRGAAGLTTQFEGSMRTPDGEERLIDFKVQPLRGLDGEVAYIIGTGVDVTDRVRP